MIWMIVAIVATLMLTASVAYGYFEMKSFNQQLTDQKAKIEEISEKNKTLENAASAAVSTTTNSVQASQFYKVPELGIQFKLGAGLQDLTYYVKQNLMVVSTHTLRLAHL